MRVIAGKARRVQLKTVPGMETRPTTDRIKETLFNILHRDTLIIVEASLETDFSYIEGYGYALVREKTYKTNKHIFLKIK